MVFSFAKKTQIVFFCIIVIFCGLSCQSLDQTQKLKQLKLNHKHSNSSLIDKNYFEYIANLNYLKAETALFSADFITALKYLKKAKAFAPQSIHFQKKMAELYKKQGLSALAVEEYKELIQKTNNKVFREKLIDLYAEQGLDKQALEQIDLLLQKPAPNFQLILKKSVLLSQKENWTEALKALKTAEKQASLLEETIQTLLFRAYIFVKQNKAEKSLEILKQIEELDFPVEKLALQTAEFYQNFSAKKASLYLKGFQDKKGISPAVSTALLNSAISSKNWENAEQYIQQLKDLGELEEQHYFYKTLFLAKEGQYKRAILYLKDLIAQSPHNGHYNYLLALNYENSLQWSKAIKIYQKMPAQSSYFLVAQLRLAQLWQKQGKYKKSFNRLKHLAFKDPVSPQAVLLYAESLWNIGNKKKALSILSKALKYHPNHSDILFLRGFYFKQTGAVKLALEDMNQILKNDSNHSEALKLIASLN